VNKMKSTQFADRGALDWLRDPQRKMTMTLDNAYQTSGRQATHRELFHPWLDLLKSTTQITRDLDEDSHSGPRSFHHNPDRDRGLVEDSNLYVSFGNGCSIQQGIQSTSEPLRVSYKLSSIQRLDPQLMLLQIPQLKSQKGLGRQSESSRQVIRSLYSIKVHPAP
jgi:hypothetical protein